jgi:hypothetical protein
LGAAINSFVMKKYSIFKLNMIIYFIGLTASYFLTFLAFYLQNSVLSIVFPGFLGFFNLPLHPHNIAFMCEVAYPVSIEIYNLLNK